MPTVGRGRGRRGLRTRSQEGTRRRPAPSERRRSRLLTAVSLERGPPTRRGLAASAGDAVAPGIRLCMRPGRAGLGPGGHVAQRAPPPH